MEWVRPAIWCGGETGGGAEGARATRSLRAAMPGSMSASGVASTGGASGIASAGGSGAASTMGTGCGSGGCGSGGCGSGGGGSGMAGELQRWRVAIQRLNGLFGRRWRRWSGDYGGLDRRHFSDGWWRGWRRGGCVGNGGSGGRIIGAACLATVPATLRQQHLRKLLIWAWGRCLLLNRHLVRPLRRSQHDRAEPGAGCKGQNQAGGHGGGLQVHFSCPGFSGRPSKPVQSGWVYLMQIDTQFLRLREYKQTYRAALMAPPGDFCHFKIRSIRRALPRGGERIRRGERYRAAVQPA